MYICRYCGRNLKKEYDTCPGCGSSSFERIEESGVVKITTPPKDGYNIKIKGYEKTRKISNIFMIAGILTVVFMIIFEIPFLVGGLLALETDQEFGLSFIFISAPITLIFILVGIGFVFGGYKNKRRAEKNIQRITKLARTGTLIKNLPYVLVDSGVYINNESIKCIEVIYKKDNNKTIPLRSEPKYDYHLHKNEGTVDLLIDPQDETNYYIDIEIY